jgi:DNA-directed RNA polymerase specialized sigma24 family protein
VLITVREAAADEFRDALSQLPQEYRELVGPWA